MITDPKFLWVKQSSISSDKQLKASLHTHTQNENLSQHFGLCDVGWLLLGFGSTVAKISFAKVSMANSFAVDYLSFAVCRHEI